MGSRSCELKALVLTSVGLDIAEDLKDDVLGHETVLQMSVQHDLDGIRHLEPELAGDERCCHLGCADTGAEAAGSAVCGRMRVGRCRDFTRFRVSLLMHDRVADALADMQFFNSEFLCDVDARIIVDIVVVGDGSRHAVVKYDCHLVRIINLFRTHLLQGILEIRGVDVMDHEHIRMCDNYVSRNNMVNAGVFLQNLLDQRIAALSSCRVVEFRIPVMGQAGCHAHLCVLDEAAVFHDCKKILRDLPDREGLAVHTDALSDTDCHDVSALAGILDAVAGDQDNSAVKSVPEEDSRKALCDDALDSVAGEDCSCLLAGAAAAEIASRDQDVSRLDRRTELGFQKLERVLFHLLDRRNSAALARNDGIGINVIAEFPDFSFEFLFHGHSSLDLAVRCADNCLDRSCRDCRVIASHASCKCIHTGREQQLAVSHCSGSLLNDAVIARC